MAAVRLFVERAQAVAPDFALTDAERARRWPRSAGGWTGCRWRSSWPRRGSRLLPPAALLARLERRLPLLTGGPRDAPARQRTMRDAIAWSYDLLTAEEQALFRRLAVFAGGFTLEAAEAVASRGVEESSSREEDGLLLDSSTSRLLDYVRPRRRAGRQEPAASRGGLAATGSEPRFGMLETIREFALERLAASGEEEAVRAARTPPGAWRWPSGRSRS